MEQRNVVLAIVISVAILLSFELLYNAPQREAELERQQTEQQVAQDEQGTGAGVGNGERARPRTGAPASADAPNREQVISGTPRVAIDTPSLTGSISLVGARVDDLTLRNYKRTIEPGSPNINLLSPPGSQQAYYADFGWIGLQGAKGLPGPDTRWQASGDRLTPRQDVTLTWTNEAGLTFERTFSLDEDFMFTVTQRVVNRSGEPVSLAPYGLISRRGTPEVLGFYILHEGPIGVFKGTLKELDYDDVRDDSPVVQETTGGWIGITDKYWLVSLIPDQDRPVDTRFVHEVSGGVDKYQSDFVYDAVRVEPGASVESTSRLFAGAKVVNVLDRYKDEFGIPHFDKAVDFGWFYFLTKPLFQGLHFFAELTGNFGVAILILVVIIKIIFFPLANKSYRSMAKMRNLQPEMVKLRERFGDDKQRLNQEMMALYKREGANPASGCLPILIQIPVFFCLYKVLFVTIEMRHAPFIGWIRDLSAKDPTTVMNLFGLLPWGAPDLGPLNVLNIGVLPLIMGLTMYGQHLLNPQPADPMQARIFKLMPIFFTFLLAQFPAGLVVYWTSNNVLTIIQQYVIMKRAGAQIGGKMAPMSIGSTGSSGGGNSGTPNAPKGEDPEAEEKTPKPAAVEADSATETPQAAGHGAAAAGGGGKGQRSGQRRKGARGSSNPAAKSSARGSRSRKGRKPR